MRILLATLLLLSVTPLAAAARADTPADSATGTDSEFFELRIRPILVGTCFKCHGGETVSGGLRVDSRAALVSGGEHGAAILPGYAPESLLVQALRHEHDEVRMPPDEPLAKESVDAFATWIQRGAEWPAASSTQPFESERHWAFRPVRATAPPLDNNHPAASPIDRFLQAGRRAAGLSPVGPAGKAALLRRATFDLIGLPPDPAELDRFLEDDSPNAFAMVVERLLASPRYGERWGRHWLDVVRYADTAGDNADYPVPEARLYRDYVTDAFNADKPYDQFVREQLAGDLLANDLLVKGALAEGQAEERAKYREQITATGFLALSRRYATAPYELWHLTLEDTIDTTGRAFLGLTLRCARCHDHKFDPVTQADYYALYGIFESTQFPWAGGEEFQSKKTPRLHFAPLVPATEAEPHAAAMRTSVERLTAEIAAAERSENKELLGKLNDELRPWQQAFKLDAPPEVPVAYAVRDGKPGNACIHLRGEPSSPGPVVPRGVPKFLAGDQPPVMPDGASGRRQLADWLTSPDHPLTARVMANRVWQWHFGRGLVATPSNFGLRGSAPTHPDFLDWLARRLIDSGWSIKALHREILRSEAYALASDDREENLAKDPDNLTYWRFDRRRLDAEAIRDAMLSVAGQLELNRPAEHPFPPVKDWKWSQHSPFKASYPSKQRSVYLMTQRIQRHPYLALFDGPDTNTSTDVRTSATVPSQALYLMNNPLVSEQADALARRLIAAAAEPAKRIELAALLCWSRRPSAAEVERAQSYIERVSAELVAVQTPGERVEREAWTSYARVLLASNEFVYID